MVEVISLGETRRLTADLIAREQM